MKLIIDIPGRYKVLGEIERYEEGVTWSFWLRGHELPALAPSGMVRKEDNGDIVLFHR